MPSAVVGALRVDLAMDSAAFEAGTKQARAGLLDISKTAKIAGAAIGTALVAAAGTVAVAVRDTLIHADQMVKAAQKIGVPVETLSRLAHAADLSGVSVEQLSTGVGRLARNMRDATRNATGTAAEAFADLGIEIKNADGSLRDVDAVMLDVAERFSQAEDGAAKTALAMELFGRSGAELIPLFNSGAEGMRKMMREADDLGIVIDEKTARAAENFNDNLTRMGRVWDGLMVQLTAELAPALEGLSEILLAGAKASAALDQHMATLDQTAADLGLKKEAVGTFFEAVKTGAINAIPFVGPLYNALRGMAAITEASADENFGLKFGDFTMPGDPNAEQEDPDEARKRRLEELQAAADAAADALKRKQEIEAEGIALMEQMRTPQEAYEAHLRELQKLLAAGAIEAETFERAQALASADIANHYASVASAGAAALGSLFEDNKGVAIASAIVNTLEGITAALKLPFPLNWAQAGAVSAAGFAQVAKIRSTTRGTRSGGASIAGGGSAGAGAFSGGGGGNDAARRGGAGQAAATTTGPSQAIHITLNGETFNREQVRELAERLLDYQADGGRVFIK